MLRALALLALLVAPSALAAPTPAIAPLPRVCTGGGAVWTGEAIYVMGGCDDHSGDRSDIVLRFDPATRALETMDAAIPRAACCHAAFWDGRLVHFLAVDGEALRFWRYDPARDVATPSRTTLALGREMGALAYDGRYAYLAGGLAPDARRIVRYDPVADEARLMQARLTTPGAGTAAVWAEGAAWFLGEGYYAGGASSEIQRYDPTNDSIESLDATLPAARAQAIAVKVGREVLLVGGSGDTEGGGARVLRFDPAARAATTMEATLPREQVDPAVAYDGERVWIFGGASPAFGGSQDVLALDPATGRLEEVAVPLPTSMGHAAVAADDERIYAFGGAGPQGRPSDRIARYDPDTGATEAMGARLPEPLTGGRAVWTGSGFILFGGRVAIDARSYEAGEFRGLWRYDPRADALTPSAVTLPAQPTEGFWDGARLVLLAYDPSAGVLRYDPVADTLARSEATFEGEAPTFALWDGEAAWIASGDPRGGRLWRYDPAADRATPLAVRLPERRRDVSLVPAGGLAYAIEEREVSTLDLRTGDSDGLPTLIPEARDWRDPRERNAVAFEGALYVLGHGPAPLRIATDGQDTFAYRARGANLSVDATPLFGRVPSGTEHLWEWGDGSRTPGGPLAQHLYARPGEYEVRLRAGPGGPEWTRNLSIAFNVPPTVDFDVEPWGGLHVVVRDNSRDPDEDGRRSHERMRALVDWGDGTPALEGQGTFEHDYAAAGTYDVTLTVTDAAGASASSTRTVEAHEDTHSDVPAPPLLALVALALVATSIRRSHRRG